MTLKPFSDTIDSEQETFQPVEGSEPGLEPFSAGIHQVAADTFGGEGSGHHDHEGRPGKVGGSQPGEGVAKKKPYVSSTKKAADEMEKEYKKFILKTGMGRGHRQGLGLEVKKVGEEYKLVEKAPEKITQTGPEGWLDEKPEEIRAAYLKVMRAFNVPEREVHTAMGAWKAGDDLTEKQEKMVKAAFPGIGDPEELPTFFPIHRTDTIADPLLTFEKGKRMAPVKEEPWDWAKEQRLEKEEKDRIRMEDYNFAKELGLASTEDTKTVKEGGNISKETWKKIGPIMRTMQSKPLDLTPEQTKAFRKIWPKTIEEALELAKERGEK